MCFSLALSVFVFVLVCFRSLLLFVLLFFVCVQVPPPDYAETVASSNSEAAANTQLPSAPAASMDSGEPDAMEEQQPADVPLSQDLGRHHNKRKSTAEGADEGQSGSNKRGKNSTGAAVAAASNTMS